MSKEGVRNHKMATIAEVYNRIVWDSRLNRNMFIAGFYERISDGIREKPLAQWDDNSDIPWHRVRYIRCGNTIVWDRENRVDLVSIDQLPLSAWKSNDSDDWAALVANNQGKFKSRSIYQYDGAEWRVFEGKVRSMNIDALTIVSYNILSDLHDPEKIATDKRLPIILQELEKTGADIIALQEVTPRSIEFILATDWVKDCYISEAASGNNVKPYGNVIISRSPFNLVEHHFSAHKRVLVGIWSFNDRSLNLANVHLTSDRGDNALQKRIQQLATVIGYLEQQSGDCLIVGDFNTRENEQDEIINYGKFVDLWQKLAPNKLGYTFNPDLNPLAMLMSLEGKPARFDRILLHQKSSPNYQPDSISLFGCNPLEETDEKIFPSDHFGIRATLKSQSSNNLSIIENCEDLTTIRPVYESILVIIPPEDLFPSIQAIRQQYDSGFVRIVPHITLIYGFLPDKYFEEVVDIIAPILARLSPFTVTLTDFQIFTHHKTSTAWLRPVVKPEGALHELQNILYQLFPQCYEQSTKTDAGFNPHLSVGQFDNPEQAKVKLPQWHPVKFTVDSIALLSRRNGEPCVTRHLVGLGKILPKIPEVGELMGIVAKLEPELSQSQQLQRDTVLEIVRQACSECLGFPASLHLLGSARLGVASFSSDLDVICLIPNYIAGKRFLGMVQDSLKGLCNRSQFVIDARFPVLRLEIEGISLDLLYTQVEVIPGWESLKTQELKLQIKNPKSIVGCWDADLMVDLVKQYRSLESFKSLLKAVRAWARARDIYSNSRGFLGGFSWSLLCAYSCIDYQSKDRSLEGLIANFFEIFSQHNWSNPIALTDAAKSYHVKLPGDRIPIISSIEPCKNTARNVTRSTAHILQSEFVRGAEIITKILAGKADWNSLYEPPNLLGEYSRTLTISILREDSIELNKCLGILDGSIIGLVIQLEQLNIFVRPSTKVNIDPDTSQIILFLNIPSDCEDIIVEQIARDFISGLNGVGDSIEFDITILTHSQA